MTETYDKLNHWYGWNGGECPVHPETSIEGMTVTGTLFGICPARAVTWSHLEGGAVNVIAFRITKLYVEPQTVKREVALYRYEVVDGVVALETSETGEARRISEPVLVEFTLLPGEEP